METPIVNLGKREDPDDHGPTELCNHCRLKLSILLLRTRGGVAEETLFEFGDHLFQVKCLR